MMPPKKMSLIESSIDAEPAQMVDVQKHIKDENKKLRRPKGRGVARFHPR